MHATGVGGTLPVEFVDVDDVGGFHRLPPCADARFDHRSCDYWEDGERGSKAARPEWWQERPAPVPRPASPVRRDDPFASAERPEEPFNPFAPTSAPPTLPLLDDEELIATPSVNPFAPPPKRVEQASGEGPRKLRLLARGGAIFGSYAKLAVIGEEPVAYAQFGPLSAYPRAQHIRELYPQLPQSPLPAVITCVASIPSVRGRGVTQALVGAVVADLAGRGFSAVEAYPDLTLRPDEASAAYPRFWLACGFQLAADDDRYPVVRLDLGDSIKVP